jgi:hypothetical protein
MEVAAGVNNLTGEGVAVEMAAVDNEFIGVGHRDGKWVLTLNVSSPGAKGLQFLFQDVRLSLGSELLLWEADSTGQALTLRARYNGTGPLGTGEFWSAAVPGSRALIEVVLGEAAGGGVPFRLASLRHLSEEGLLKITTPSTADMPQRAELEGTSGTAIFRGMEVPYQVRNGLAVFEGDIILGRVEELELASGKGKSGHREAVGITSTQYRWPGGVIPYTIDPAMPSQDRITNAVNHWNTNLDGVIRLVPRTNETYWVKFTRPASASTCSSYVGYMRMADQPINIGDYCSTGNTIHEIGHAVGAFHEHTREDRDRYVQILWDNIRAGASNNFAQNISTSDDIGAYDYGSIMHYPAYAFSANGNPTIVTIPAGIPIGQRSGLSAGDISGARTMYSGTTTTPPTSTVQVNLATNPTGRQLVVDGVTVTAPVSYLWTVGSVHTLSAVNATVGGTRYLFSSWSNGGAQTQSFTTPTASLTLTASFATQYQFTSSSNNTSLGQVSQSPTSADSFYNAGSSVSVAAAPSTGACLGSWSGITAPPNTPLQVTVSQPYSVVGNFTTGAVSVSPTSLSFNSPGGTASINVTVSSGCPWQATENANWIALSPKSGTSSGQVQVTVSKNNTKQARSANIFIGAVAVSIQQAGR